MSELSHDRQTVNILVLELATMVVAIALAFSASFLNVLDLSALLSFMLANLIVIWFWWDYVIDRLTHPPKTERFPVPDVLILVLISLFPYVLKQGSITYISGLMSALLFVWAIVIRQISKENSGSLDSAMVHRLRVETVQRLLVGGVFAIDAVIETFLSTMAARLIFLFLWDQSLVGTSERG